MAWKRITKTAWESKSKAMQLLYPNNYAEAKSLRKYTITYGPSRSASGWKRKDFNSKIQALRFASRIRKAK